MVRVYMTSAKMDIIERGSQMGDISDGEESPWWIAVPRHRISLAPISDRYQRYKRLITRSITNYKLAEPRSREESQWNERNHKFKRLLGKVSLPSHIPEQPTDPSLAEKDHGADKHMNLELYRAATKDDVDAFLDVLERVSTEKALSLPAIFDQVSPLEITLLHIATSFGNKDTVELIVDNYPTLLTKRNSKGDTALHVAARAGHISIVKTLVFFQRDDTVGSSFSARRDHDVLLRIRNEEGNTALHEAVINHHEPVALNLVKAYPEVSYVLNNEGKSALYLAAKAGYGECVKEMLGDKVGNMNPEEMLEGESIVHAAIMGRNIDVLDTILNKGPHFINLRPRDEEGRTPLHYAAYIGYLKGVRSLCKYTPGAMERDKNSFFPIHLASIKGHVDVIQELLQHCLDPKALLDDNGQNILHVAAKSGKYNVVSYILKTPELERLINERDKDGNTPLHLATMHWYPNIVNALAWNKRVDLKLVNREGLTALDAALEYNMETMAQFRKPLTLIAMSIAGAPRSQDGEILNANRRTSSMKSKTPNMDNYAIEDTQHAPQSLHGEVLNANRRTSAMQSKTPNIDNYAIEDTQPAPRSLHGEVLNANRQTSAMQSETPNMDNYKEIVNTLILVSTIVATVTFAAGFTMPGGSDNSDPDLQNMATMLTQKKFHIFIICDTIAMYSSIMAAIILFNAQLGDLNLVLRALEWALPLLSIALTTMSLAFTAGIYLVVSKLGWLANAVMIMGLVGLVTLQVLLFPHWFTFPSRFRILRYISYYLLVLLIKLYG